MLSSLIVQLCACRPDFPEQLSHLDRERCAKTRPALNSLVDAFRATIADLEYVYLVIDALDECSDLNEERQTLLDMLEQIHSWPESNLHLLVTSRQKNDIDGTFRPLVRSKSAVEINLEVYKDSVNHDIDTFIEKKLAAPKFQNWNKAKIKARLIDKADGM